MLLLVPIIVLLSQAITCPTLFSIDIMIIRPRGFTLNELLLVTTIMSEQSFRYSGPSLETRISIFKILRDSPDDLANVLRELHAHRDPRRFVSLINVSDTLLMVSDDVPESFWRNFASSNFPEMAFVLACNDSTYVQDQEELSNSTHHSCP